MPDYMQIYNALHPTLRNSGQGSGTPGQDMNQSDDGTAASDDDPFLALLTKGQANTPDSTADAALASNDATSADPNKGLGGQTGGRIKLPPRDKNMLRPETTPAYTAALYKQIVGLGAASPFRDNSTKDKNGLVAPAPLNENFYPDILALGAHYGFYPSNPDPKSGEIMGLNSPHSHTSRRDPHFYGQAVDFALGKKDSSGRWTKNQHTNAEIDYFIQQAIANGYSVEDVRDPKNGGAHIHIQSTFQPAGRYMYSDGTYTVDQNGHKHYHAKNPPSFVRLDSINAKAGRPMRPVASPTTNQDAATTTPLGDSQADGQQSQDLYQ